MKSFIIEAFRKLLPKPIKNILKRFFYFFTWDQWAIRTWSQEGEDQILKRIFESKKNGFYVDIGAHHPKRLSNTCLFYKLGWHGINIDAMPGSMNAFNKARPRDINIEVGIGEQEGEIDYYVFNEPALNSFSRNLSNERNCSDSDFQIESVIKIKIMPLHKILDKYLPPGQSIDFISIDVEGFDFQVLKSNNWKKYRPKYLLVEILSSSLHEVYQSEIGKFLQDVGYIPYAKTMNTVFFKETLPV